MRDMKRSFMDSIRQQLAQGDNSLTFDMLEQRIRENVKGELHDDFLSLLAYLHMILLKADNGNLNADAISGIRSALTSIQTRYGVGDSIEQGVRDSEAQYRSGILDSSKLKALGPLREMD